jgi:hypothetical protein
MINVSSNYLTIFFVLIFSDSFQPGVSMVTNVAAVGIICNVRSRDGHSS